MVSTLFRDPQARSSALAALGMLQPRAFGSLNRVETLDSSSNYYVRLQMKIRLVLLHGVEGCLLFRGYYCIEEYGETVGTFKSIYGVCS